MYVYTHIIYIYTYYPPSSATQVFVCMLMLCLRGMGRFANMSHAHAERSKEWHGKKTVLSTMPVVARSRHSVVSECDKTAQEWRSRPTEAN